MGVMKMSIKVLCNNHANTTYQGITCMKCGLPYDNYDPGSLMYQEHYGPPLPAICDICLNRIFNEIGKW